MDDFPSNSKRSKAQQGQDSTPSEPARERRVEQIVDGSEVTVRKRAWHRRIGDSMRTSDGQSLGSWFWYDMLQPMLRSVAYDAIEGTTRRAVLGDNRGGSRSSSYGSGYGYGTAPTNYASRYSSPSAPPPTISARGRQYHEFNEISIPDRFKVEEVRSRLYALIENHGVARVADFYDAVGITPTTQDDRYGWADLGGGHIRRVHDGFVLELPRPIPIER